MIIDNIIELTKNSSDDNEYLIDNQKYIVKLVFINPDGSVLPLSKSNLKELTINDNTFEPFNYSTISFVDNDNSFQRLNTDKSETEFQPELDILKGYNFRGDGRDFLFIEIIPVENTNTSYGLQEEDYYKKFGYRNLFVCIDDNENVENGNKIKRFNLMDFDHKLLKERKSFFSSSNLIESETPKFLLSNKDREVSTGICIKNLLKNILLAKSFDQIVDVIGDDFTPDFEDGVSKIFYTSTGNNNAYEDLLYILSKHVSDYSNNDFSIFKKDNFTNKYSLRSVSSLFDNAYNDGNDSAGNQNLEKIIITGSSDSDNFIQNSKKTPITIASFGQYSEVKDIKFFNTDSLINSNKLTTKALHSYNFNQKSFNVDKKESDLVNVRENFDKNYVKNMKGDQNEPYPNFLINQTKSLNLGFDNEYSLYGENTFLKQSEGLNKLLKSSIITNLAAEITLKGQLFRRSGKFISIDREGQYVDNLFDKKFLGIYFILNVDHLFINDTTYLNKILAVKTYIFDNPKFSENTL